MTGLLQLRAHRLAELGKFDAALDSVLEHLRLGELLSTAPATMVESIRGNLVQFTALELLLELACMPGIQPRQLRRALDRLPDDNDRRSALQRTLQMQYVLEKKSALRMRDTGDLRIRWFWTPHRIINIHGDNTRRAIAHLEQETWPGPLVDLMDRNTGHGPLTPPLLRMAFGTSQLELQVQLPYQARARHLLHRVALALRIHELEQGQLPGSLEVLSPGIVRAVPRDPFSGKPFIYLRERRIIYSVGTDGVDSNGTWEQSADVVVELDAPH